MTTDNDGPKACPPPSPGEGLGEGIPGAGFSVVPASSGSRTRRISHDQYFKSLITQYPRQALALFDPARFASLDDSVVITPLRQELPPDRLGERFFELDIPLEVRWPDGSRETMVILIEHQTIPSRFRIKKLLMYYVKLSEVLHTDIITPIVIFLRDGRDIPVRLGMGPLDRRHAFFDYIPVILPRWKAIEHLGTDNVVEQVLLTTMSRKDQDKVFILGQAIKALLRLEKNIDNQLNFERFIRTYAPLDAEEERRYNETYADEVAHMMSVREEVISSVREELERKGEARGRLIGREEGREEGIQIGERQGTVNGQRQTLARQLARRFGPLDPATERRLAEAGAEQLDYWTDAILTAGSLEEVFRLQ